MNLKIIAGSIPLLLLSASLWVFARSGEPAPLLAASPVASAGEVPGLEASVAGRYAFFDMAETFVLPAGPRGLEYSDAARRMDGRMVRVSGSMVRHYHDDPAVFLLTPQPMVLNMAEYGLADDLPAHAVLVILPVLPSMAPDWVRQPLTVFGRMELGPRQEQDGRISQIRLHADHITAADGRTLIEPRRSVLLQPARVRSGRLAASPASTNPPD